MPSSASSTTPTSEGSNQGFVHLPVDETIRNNRHTPTSPRIALLSHTSLQQTAAEPPSASTDRRSHSSQRAVEKRWDVRKKSSRDRRKRTSTPHEASLVNLSHFRELDRFSDPRAEAVSLRGMLETAMRQIQVESQHAADLQRANDEVANRFRILNENRINAQQEAAKATSERKLYQYQLESAQKEVEKAKTALKEIEKQRDDAETAAARAREKARKWQLEVMVTAAREEGRKYGFEAGFNHAKQEKEILAVRRPRPVPRLLPPSSKGKEREYYPEEYHKRPRRITLGKSHTGDDTSSSPEMSPSQLPIRNLPDQNPPSIRAGTSKSAPRRPFQPPPESDGDEDYESETEAEAPPRRPQSRPKTPSVQVWSVDVPAAEKIDESFNSNENPNAAVPHGRQDRWVTAKRHTEIRGPKHLQDDKVTTQIQPFNQPTQQLLQFPIKQPPPPPLPIFPSASVTAFGPPESAAPFKAPLPSKSVHFWAKRPSLSKTKQHAASWYRSFSFRKKNKPVIDPIAEEPAETPPASAVSTFATTAPEPKTSSTEPPETKDSDNVYGPSSQQLHSWYQQKRLSVPASMKSQDATFVRRQPTSDASGSTRVSQFDLLSTPALEANTSITQRVKGKGHVKEKESSLSVIKEDSASRGIPSVRSFGPSGRADSTSAMDPKYGQERAVGQKSSYHSIQNRHRPHRPQSIVVPDYDATLEPPGAAYARQAAYQGYDSNLNLLRKPSIEIDVVPPSGTAPDYTQSPPHTGRNHLSPYHQFNPTRSIHSLKNFDTMTEPPRAPTQSEYPSAHSRFASAGLAPNRQYDPSSSPLQPPRSLFGKDPISRPESVRSSASKHHLRNNTPSGTFKIANPDPPPPPNSSGARPRASRATLVDVVAPISEGGEAGAIVLAPRRETSRASMRSQHSHFSRYNPEEYIDPAYWGVTGPGSPPAAVPAQPKPGMELSAEDLNRAPSRLPSANSVLSYA